MQATSGLAYARPEIPKARAIVPPACICRRSWKKRVKEGQTFITLAVYGTATNNERPLPRRIVVLGRKIDKEP